MIVIPNDKSAFFDCDETLVIWDFDRNLYTGIRITSPDGLVSEMVNPHIGHIKKLKEHKLRGQLVVVWSAGGYAWAETVVKALGLENYVDYVMAKPAWAWDDLTPNEFIKRCYIKPGEMEEKSRTP